jgi:hypothetical protein
VDGMLYVVPSAMMYIFLCFPGWSSSREIAYNIDVFFKELGFSLFKRIINEHIREASKR